MFESLVKLDAAGCIAAVEASERLLIVESCRKLVLAAQWADLHPGQVCDPVSGESRLPGWETPWRPGGAGTPSIASFCPAELGCALGVSDGSAMKLIGDALDVRHRLPLTWRRIWHAEIPGHLARTIAHTTHHLSLAQARQVDADIAHKLGALPYNRLLTCLDAAVLAADPDGAEAAAQQAMRDRFVRLGRSSHYGLKWIIARATAGDALYLNAMLNRVADILAIQGDTDSIDVRRSKALGLLAQPAETLRLLYTHAHDNDDDPAEPDTDTDTAPGTANAQAAEAAAGAAAGAAAAADNEPESHTDLKPEPEPEPELEPDADHQTVRIMRPPFDPARARPTTIIYLHLSGEALNAGSGVARMEGVGPVLLTQLRGLLGDHVQIKLQPVIDLNDEPAPVDSYEIPHRIREHLILTTPADQWPWAAGMTRTPDRTCDLDHIQAYLAPDHGGPPGQTGTGTLAPFIRYHHRVKTFAAGWDVRHPEPGSYLFRTPHGRIYLVNSSGTHPIGHGTYAQTIWHAANPAAHTLAS